MVIFILMVFNGQVAPERAIADLGDDYFEDFEGTVFPGWTKTGFWHIEDNDTSLWSVFNIPSDSHYAWYGNSTSGNYYTGDSPNYGDLTSDTIDLTGLAEPIELGFHSRAQTENIEGVDTKTVLISSDGGNSWKELGQIPDDDTWKYWSFDITDFKASNNVKIRFSFDTGDSIANMYPGWMIDNIRIGKPIGRFDLWIKQDSYAFIYDIRMMEFFATSFYDYSMYVNISIDILTPSGMQNLYYEENVFIDRYGTWDYWIDYQFNEAGDFWVYFSLINETGTEWVTECWWIVEKNVFGLWIEQDNYAFQYESRPMNFIAKSYFSHGMYANITAFIDTPSYSTESLFNEIGVWIEPYGRLERTFDYEFKEHGRYWVYFILIDENGTEWYMDCWWDIEPPKQDIFILWIEQDNYAGITDIRKMGFHVESYFSYSMEVDILVEIITPSSVYETLFIEEMVQIEANGYWENWLDYTFTQTGEYLVIFTLIDNLGNEWVVDCWWVVEANFFDLWIEQEYYAGVTDWRNMSFHMKSYYNYGMYVNISIDILTPSGIENIVSFESVWTEAFTSWDYSLEYQFTEVGEYSVLFSVVDETGAGWARECPWSVESDFFGTRIEQDYQAFVGETRTMKFITKSYFNYSKYVDIFIEIYTPYGVEILYQEEAVWFDAFTSWDYSIDYTFTGIGDYKVLFSVIDEYGSEWGIDCLWKIVEKGYFNLKIDQDQSAEVGDLGKMTFLIQSHFNYNMEVNLNVTIKTPSGIIEPLYNEIVWIEEGGTWSHTLGYEFKEIGKYQVLFVLIDDIGVKWTTDCIWDIVSPGTEETESTGNTEIPSVNTPGFETLIIIVAIAAIATHYRRRHG